MIRTETIFHGIKSLPKDVTNIIGEYDTSYDHKVSPYVRKNFFLRRFGMWLAYRHKGDEANLFDAQSIYHPDMNIEEYIICYSPRFKDTNNV